MSKKVKRVLSALQKSSATTLETLSLFSLAKFCSKNLFEIELVTPLTLEDQKFLEQIVAIGKKFEYLSDVHFITYIDVLNLIERLAQKDPKVDLPKFAKECAEEVVLKYLEMQPLPLDFLATMTKLKIIESMYKIYSSNISSMQRRHELHEQLAGLLRDCEPKEKAGKKSKKKDKKGNSSKGSKTSKSKKSDKESKKIKKSEKKTKKKASKTVIKEPSKTEVRIDNYTEIPLEENELIFDYNVDNHLMYFVLSGFSDPQILEKLAKVQVEVSAIIDVSLESSTKSYDDFILKLEGLFETPSSTDYLENTVWLKYRSSGKSKWKEILEEFLYVVKKINYVKRQHLSYIKHLNLHDSELTLKKLNPMCIEKYTRILNSYPAELVNIPLIIDALVQEICWRELGPNYSLLDLTPSTESVQLIRNNPKSYQVHEEDILRMGLETYKSLGRNYYDKSLEYMKLLHPFSEMDRTPKTGVQNRLISTEDDCYCDNMKELFDYFHLGIFSQMNRQQYVPKSPMEYDLSSILVTHDRVKEYKEALPKGGGVCDAQDDIIVNYHFKEDLSTSVLRQLIFKAMNDYSCWDRCYCEESDCVLVRFHDNLDDFGIDTKIWGQKLRTPVCLRDFCRFVTNEEQVWLKQHKLTQHAKLNDGGDDEKCEGLKDMHVYQEYQHLLGTATGVSNEEKKKIFDGVLTELLHYPKSGTLRNYCSKVGSLLSYDLGPKMCQVTGHTTIFRSDDGVKVTIDTSRFMVEDPKCTIRIATDDHTLVFHANRPSAFHFILKDETIVNFTELERRLEKIPSFIQTENEITDDKSSFESNAEEQQQEEKESETSVSNYNNFWIQMLRKSKITTAIPNFFTKTPISDKKVKLDNKNLDRLLELFKAAVYMQRSINKISTKRSVRLLQRTTSPSYLPLVTILKRILFKPVHKKRKIGGYSVLNITRMIKKVPLKYDFQITLPNGLIITTITRSRQLAEVKQEYKFSTFKERYRIFYANGVVMIKNFDETSTILRCNGDIITLTDQSEYHSLKCAQNIAHVFKNEEDEACPYRTSRCKSSGETKVLALSNFPDLYEFGNIPYTEKVVLQFDGKQISVSEDKVTERQLYYILTEHDYHAEEMSYEREDGMKCIVDKRGKQVFQFPDGTKMTAYPQFEKELIYVTNNPKVEGWVSVIVNYKFEHPDYITVAYDAIGGSTQIFLKDAVVKNSRDSFIMSTNKNIALEVTSNSVILLKTCESCDGDCVSKIHLDQRPKLLEVFDSYDKYLSCDHTGHCEINSNFIKHSFNKNNCDHRWKNVNQKLFVLNSRGPPGTLLWKDSVIEDRSIKAKFCKNVKVVNYMNKLIKKQTVEFFTDVYHSFAGRFTMSDLYQHDICLSKYKHNNLEERNRLFCVTFWIVIEFQNSLKHPERLSELNDFLENKMSGISPELLKGIQRILNYVQGNNSKVDRCSFRLEMKDGQESSDSTNSLSKSIDLEKTTVHHVIAKWRKSRDHYRALIRNETFPPYFHSDYYHYIKSRLKVA